MGRRFGPQTLEAAKKHRYGAWAGNPNGRPYDPSRCAAEVSDAGRSCGFHQCRKKPGHGPGGLWCRTHDPEAIKAYDSAVKALVCACIASPPRAIAGPGLHACWFCGKDVGHADSCPFDAVLKARTRLKGGE